MSSVMSIAMKKKWCDPHYRKVMTEGIISFLRFKRPTSLEIKMDAILQEHYPREWKYVGDGQVLIGWKNPDFINVNGRKAVIEVLGRHWHPEGDDIKLHLHYKKWGFNCLSIWEEELENPSLVKFKLDTFMGAM